MRTSNILQSLTIAVLAAAFLLLILNLSSSRHAQSAAMVEPVELTDVQFASLLHRAGLTAEHLAAAGVSPSSVSTVVLAAHAALVENLQSLESADSDHAANASVAAHLRRRIRSGQQQEGDQDDLAAAQQAATAAAALRQDILQEAFDAAVSELVDGEIATLVTLRGNRHRDAPTEYLVLVEPEAQWLQLRDALANERISLELDEEPDPDSQLVLSEWRSDAAVAAASYAMDINLPQVKQQWLSAIEAATSD